jgi:hypothetical protein
VVITDKDDKEEGLITYKTTKSSSRGSTLSVRVVGSPNDRSIPFTLNERRKVYLPPFLGFPDSGSTLQRAGKNITVGEGKGYLRTI